MSSFHAKCQPLLPPKPQALRCNGLHRRADTTPTTQRGTLHPSCGTPLAPATGCTHRAHDPPGSAAPTFCASLRCPRRHPTSRIMPSAPSQSSMDAPPPHRPASSRRSKASIPRTLAVCCANGKSPLICPRCGNCVRVLAIITDLSRVGRILRHLIKTGRAPPRHTIAPRH